MLICPRCEVSLKPVQGSVGTLWRCPECQGRGVGAAVLRRSVAASAVNEVWQAARNGSAPEGVACPACRRPTRSVSIDVDDDSLAIDVCQPCQFLWLDTTELERLPAAPVEQRAQDQAAEALAQFDLQHRKHMEELRPNRARGPEERWKLLPALVGLPVEVDSPGEADSPWLTWLLVGLTSLLSLGALRDVRTVIADWGFVPDLALRKGGLTFLTSFFLHAGVPHLVFNMYFLWVFGDDVESRAGRSKYALLLLLATVAGCLAHAITTGRPELPLVGASAGISGVLAYYAVVFPRARLATLILVCWVNYSARMGLVFWLLMQALGTIKGVSDVSNAGHLGGAAVGLLFGWAEGRRRT